MEGFRFVRENDTFKWESNFMVLEFSNPSIQGFSEHAYLTSAEEIFHYYYCVKIYKKTHRWDEDDNQSTEVTLVCERNTYDFPRILSLKNILEFQLKDNTVIGGQKIEYVLGDVRYSKSVETEGFGCDDFYEVKKSVDADGENEKYVVYCGTTFDAQGDLNSVGLRTPYVERKDIEALLACVNEFVQYTLDEHNDQVRLWNSVYGVENGKIYEYELQKNGVNKDVIEAMHTTGEVLDIVSLVDNKETKHSDVVLSKIETDAVYLTDGERIATDTICYVSNNPTDEMIRYKEEEITKEFVAILSPSEKEEFSKESVENLFVKYSSAIINRTWMCRGEHAFNIDYKTGDMVNAVSPVVKDIIDRVKLSLLE